MMIRHLLFSVVFSALSLLSVSADASLMICQKGRCDYTTPGVNLKPWIRQLHRFFKTPNVRIDFCEADPKSHSCLHDGLTWVAGSSVTEVHLSIPVARTLPQKRTLLIDYLVKANEFLPSCSFSNTTFEMADNDTIRLVSNAFECQINDFGRTQFQNTFFVDYIDFDNSVAGAQYTLQTHGEIRGTSTGYTMMRFRDGNTLLPLVPQPDYGPLAPAPDADMVKQLVKRQKQLQEPPPQEPENKFVNGLKDWWEQLKESFNLDKKKRPATSYDEPTWWDNFSNTFMKVIYLEPLE